ncbi:MAG: ATP-dependent DNA ligase [Actinomycetota bacterium]|nr:ATP-dependent DNA ligase [Actinomycetota bacterium]
MRPPLDPMLAHLERDIPEGPGWRYEPKWDGFRAIAFLANGDVEVSSRDGRDLQRYFPELPALLRQSLPPECVVDGEVIVAIAGRLEFDALLQRIHPAASRVARLSAETPASFVAFDLLAEGGRDMLDAPFDERRRRLGELLAGGPEAGRGSRPLGSAPPEILLTAQTDDASEARRWFDELEPFGLDGIVAKRDDQPYRPGERTMVKVKHERVADCVVGGYRRAKSGDGVGSLLLGLYDQAGVLHYVGFTSSFRAAQRREVLERLRPLEGGTSFGGGRTPGGPSRWSSGRDTSWIPVEPRLVCEVRYDHLQGDRFRHGTTFLRWRPDKPAEACGFDQVGRT